MNIKLFNSPNFIIYFSLILFIFLLSTNVFSQIQTENFQSTNIDIGNINNSKKENSEINIINIDIDKPKYQFYSLIVISNICGIIYVCAWMASYYPQAYMNYIRKRVDGLSFDLAFYNILGYIAYTIFTFSQFFYQLKHNSLNAVEPVDLIFALHSFLITSFIGFQIYIYPKGKQKFGRFFNFFLIVLFLTTLLMLITSSIGLIPWITLPNIDGESFIGSITTTYSFVQYLGYVKAIITFLKYIPQVHLNLIKRSTKGMSTLNYAFDLIGGFLSLFQNSIDAINYQDMSFIVGNIPKFVIGISTIFYDSIIISQYFFYKKNDKIQFSNNSFTQIPLSSLVSNTNITTPSEKDIDNPNENTMFLPTTKEAEMAEVSM